MCTKLLKDSRTFEFIQALDLDTETKASKGACNYCGDRLHRAYYTRKPRAPSIVLPAGFCVRPSFCCRGDACRRRKTPALLRFLDRKVYVSVIVLLVAAMTQGDSPKRLCELKAELDISPQTVHRWRHYWHAIFSRQDTWRYQRGNFLPPIADEDLPGKLLKRLTNDGQKNIDGMVSLLRLATGCSISPQPQMSQ